MEDKPQGKKWKEFRRAGYLTAIPLLLAIGPILGWFLGDLLDSKLGSGPWLSYLGILIGFVAAGREVYQLAKKAGEE
ncbi:MAG: AtpZ/AtpI family protein [candidate division Zixibacteria bacterium]|nr:AtpZ/AtpI family protein [candidate division Zixibacteria bacterium]